jgi:TPP-dependent indolepyruvate ferredoxin oxidoreductase alpha subunit
MEKYANTSPLNKVEMKGSKIGVITASAAYQYAKEAFPEDASFLKLGFTHPLPMDLIRDFASKVETLYVIEELEPYMETKIRAAGIDDEHLRIVDPLDNGAVEGNVSLADKAKFSEAEAKAASEKSDK